MPPIRTIPPAKVVKVRYINGKTLSMSGIFAFFFIIEEPDLRRHLQSSPLSHMLNLTNLITD
jgi:hypothetical protein